jgi:peptidase C25-like protein
VTPFVAIEETDVHGASRVMGPFPVPDGRLRAQLQWIEDRLDRAGVGSDLGPRVATGSAGPRLMQGLRRTARLSTRRLSGRGRRWTPLPTQGVKVRVRTAGDVFVPVEALRAQGLPTDLRRLGVTAHGRPVPFQASAAGIRFRAQALSTDWTDANVYVLSWRGTPRAPAPLTRSGDAPWPRWTRVEKSFAYVPSLPREADPWQWDLLLTGVGTWPYSWWDPSVGEFDLPGFRPTRGNVPVVLRLVGFSEHRHTVQARINGLAVGSVTFDGVGLALLEGQIPSAALQAAGNRLELDYDADVADPATEYGMVYFDHLDFGFAHARATTAPVPFELLPWDPTCPIRAADYLIVTHADFAEAASRIARAKSAEGLKPTVIDVERAYDAYSGGVPEPNAIAALVRDFAAQGGRYVLLVGDDTFDPRDYAGTGAVSFVPSAVRFDEVWGRVPSENGYADVDGDGRPEVAIGRLPVQTPEEANLLANKVVHQRERLAASAGRHLIAVDNRGPGDPPFLKDATAVPLPAGTAVTWSSVADGVDVARQALFDGLAAGAQVTHYFGHGGPEVWADEQLLTVTDVASLPAAPPTVLFTWDCQSQWYLNLWGPSLNEALLLHPDGGAVASFGPAGITTPRQQEALERGVYTRFLNGGMALGDAVRESKAESVTADPSTRAAVDGWNLLGDPALLLPASR